MGELLKAVDFVYNQAANVPQENKYHQFDHSWLLYERTYIYIHIQRYV